MQKTFLKNVFLKIIKILITIISSLFVLCSCVAYNKNLSASTSELTFITDDNKVEYNVYKKIDFSNAMWTSNTGNATIKYDVDPLYLAPAPCKIVIKANVKIENGPGLKNEDLNDCFNINARIGPVNAYIYYADYYDDFFGKFHEIEYAEEFYNGEDSGRGYVSFSLLGITNLNKDSGYAKEAFVSYNGSEYIGEFLTDDNEVVIRVTIKDIYYKVCKSSGIELEWDLNNDFEYFEYFDNALYHGEKAFAIKNIDDEYVHIIKPRFTSNVNEKYDQRAAKYLEFFGIADDGRPVTAGQFINGREKSIGFTKKRIGIGVSRASYFYHESLRTDDINIFWDKNNTTMTVVDNKGEIAGTFKIDFIKEFKYKFCKENDTPGYRRWVIAYHNR